LTAAAVRLRTHRHEHIVRRRGASGFPGFAGTMAFERRDDARSAAGNAATAANPGAAQIRGNVATPVIGGNSAAPA